MAEASPTVVTGGLPGGSVPWQCTIAVCTDDNRAATTLIRKFTGEDADGKGKSFEEWIEQFKAIADMY